ncbi:MAG: carboxypeptidase regulatory-like domain-containing protein, partial [Acidobacteria bacterium]|nr:carboxypeptidase regulatory-like domain-containing protein [Acidobacteriota bacterium]
MVFFKSSLCLPVLTLAQLLACIPTWAQDPTGHIVGTIKDSSGGVVPGASVVLTNMDTGTKRVLMTNDEGIYSAPKLQTGKYEIEVVLKGFKKHQTSGLAVGAGSYIEADVVLQIGESAEVVAVTAEASLVSTTSGARRNSMDLALLDQLPLGGRDSDRLLALVPGAVKTEKSYAINGTRETSNNFTLDGTDASDTWNAVGNKLPPPDSLKEFAVQTNYSAEYGRGAGAAIIALTKSGTNRLHGSAYDYFRSENLNANSFQRNSTGSTRGELKQHQVGFTVGGPVYLPKLYDGRNRTFFFINFQNLLQPATPYLWGRGGFTAAELAG